MVAQTVTIGKRRYVLLAERDFKRLTKLAGDGGVRPEFGREAMKELRAYRKSGKATDWAGVKKKLGL